MYHTASPPCVQYRRFSTHRRRTNRLSFRGNTRLFSRTFSISPNPTASRAPEDVQNAGAQPLEDGHTTLPLFLWALRLMQASQAESDGMTGRTVERHRGTTDTAGHELSKRTRRNPCTWR